MMSGSKFSLKTFMLIHHKGHPRLVTVLGKLYTTLMKREIDPLSEVSSKCFQCQVFISKHYHLITGCVLFKKKGVGGGADQPFFLEGDTICYLRPVQCINVPCVNQRIKL